MKKVTLLIWIIALLVVLNGAILLFINFSQRRNSGPSGFDKMIISSLSLNEAQIAKFDVMKRGHHQQMIAIDSMMRQPFGAYFSLLKSKVTDSVKKDSLEHVLADLYRKKMEITYAHFDELKSICTPEQQTKFDVIVPHLLHVISPPPPVPAPNHGM